MNPEDWVMQYQLTPTYVGVDPSSGRDSTVMVSMDINGRRYARTIPPAQNDPESIRSIQDFINPKKLVPFFRNRLDEVE